MKRQWLLALCTVLISMTMALVLAEAFLRVTGLSTPPAIISVTESQAEQIPGMFVPRETVLNRSQPRFPHRVTVNDLGYRGPDIRPARSEGTTRIFFAGDSFTWGDLVHDEETLPAQVRERLITSCADVETINAGVGGTTIVGQSEMIRRGLFLEPDLVVLTFYDNDIAEMSPPRFWEIMEENRRRKSAFPMSVVYATLNSSAIWPIARRAAARLFSVRGGGAEGKAEHARRTDAEWEAQMPTLRREYSRYLSEVASQLEGRGIPLVLVSYPSHVSLEEPDVFFNHAEWLEEIAGHLQIPFVGLLPALRESDLALEELYFIPWDGHPRPAGYQIASRIIARFLLDLDQDVRWCRDSSARVHTLQGES